jgi:hypothetical protein
LEKRAESYGINDANAQEISWAFTMEPKDGPIFDKYEQLYWNEDTPSEWSAQEIARAASNDKIFIKNLMNRLLQLLSDESPYLSTSLRNMDIDDFNTVMNHYRIMQQNELEEENNEI